MSLSIAQIPYFFARVCDFTLTFLDQQKNNFFLVILSGNNDTKNSMLRYYDNGEVVGGKKMCESKERINGEKAFVSLALASLGPASS